MNEPIQDKTPKPPGLLPKNVQSWLILGLAVLMVVIMWLTGGKKQAPPRATSTLSQGMPPVEVNQAKIAELQSRIEEQQREQLVAQNALAQQSRILGASASSGQTPSEAGGAAPEPAEDAIQAERKKRNYFSLFASNLALTYRKSASAPPASGDSATPGPAAPAALQLAQLLKDIQPGSSLPLVPAPVRNAPASPA
jgi:hypothetical protein